MGVCAGISRLAAPFWVELACWWMPKSAFSPYLHEPVVFQSLQQVFFLFLPFGLVPRSLLLDALELDLGDRDPFILLPFPFPLGVGVGERPLLSSLFFVFTKAPCFAGSWMNGQLLSRFGHFPFLDQFLQSSGFCFGASGFTAGSAV